MKNLCLIFVGGGLGSVVRYLSQIAVQKWANVFPLGVLFVNVVGSFFIGIAFAWLADKPEHFMRFLFVIGFCGGFTTFSSFSLDSFVLLKQADYLMFGLNILANVLLCLGATVLGVFVAKQLIVQ